MKAEYQSMWNDIAFIKTTFEIKPSLDIGGPRALGMSLFGELRIEPQSKENIHKLGAPSCYGLEDDNSITADYNVIFKIKASTTQIQTLKNIEINRLVFKGGMGAGMDTVSEYYFQFDKQII